MDQFLLDRAVSLFQANNWECRVMIAKNPLGFSLCFAKILNSPVLQLCLIGSDEEEARLPEVAPI